MPFTYQNNNLNEEIKIATILELLKSENVVVYTPLDPYKFTIPDTIQNYKLRKIKEHYYIAFSPNCYKIFNQYDKIPILFVNYTLPISYQYYGEEEPPERSIEEQYNDWKNGYMLCRFKLPNGKITEEKLEEIENTLGEPIPRGYYWVKYHARLVEFPPELTDIYEGVIKLTYVITSPLATTPFIKNLYEYFTNEKEKIAQNATNLLNSLGFKIDNNLQYTIGNNIYKGIQILISKDNKYYEVYVPIKKEQTAQFIQYLIIGAIIVVAICFTVSTYMIVNAVITYAKTKEDIEQEKTKQLQIKLNFLSDYPDLLPYILRDPELAKAIFDTSASLNQNPSGDDLIKYLKYGVIGIGALVGGILLVILLKYALKPNR